MSDNKVYLIDGSGYIFRAFFATPPLTNADGMPTNALYAFTRMVVRLLTDYQPHQIAVVFDTSSKNFRHELYEDYKANRTECPEDLVPQMPFFREIVKALGLVCLEKVGFEADDIIATLTTKAVSEGQEVEIFSGDKDLLQLVSDSVRVRDAMKDRLFDEKGVADKFGVGPELMTDYLALVGDSSDNIPGITGVGPKSAVKLLTELGGVEAIIVKQEEIADIKGLRGAKSIAQKVADGIEQLRLSHELVKLKHDVELEMDSDDLLRSEISYAEVEDLFSKLGFTDTKKLLGSLEFSEGSSASAIEEVEKNYELVTAENLDSVIKKLKESDRIGFDTETTSLDLLEAEVVGFSIAPEPYVSYYVPVAGEGAIPLEDFSFLFSDTSKTLCGFNLKYDVRVMRNAGVKIKAKLSDAMIAAYLLHPDRKRGGLKKMTEVHFGEVMITYEELVGDKNLSDLPHEEVAPYACHDADASLRLCDLLEGQLNGVSPKLLKLYQEMEMPLVSILAEMEEKGVLVDQEELERLRQEFDEELKGLEEKVYKLADAEFNLNSPKQVSEILFERLGLPTSGIKKTSQGFSTDVNVLNKLALSHEVPALLLEYREVSKLQGTYVKGLQKLLSDERPRVHTTYNQAVAATGRLSSSDPNLQNLPIRGERGRKVRRVFIAEEESVLLSLDYSQVELRILAHLSEDPALIDAFNTGADIHEQTAKLVFADKYEAGLSEAEAKDLRRVAKTINFGVIYGVSAFRLARELEIPRVKAKEFIDGYFDRYSLVKTYFENQTQQVEELGYAETLYGRRRFLDEIDSSGRDSGYARRSLMNFPIQGTAADIMKLAMLAVYDGFQEEIKSGDLSLIMQVHDELVFEVKRPKAEGLSTRIADKMRNCSSLLVPLEVDSEVGERWES